MADLEEPTTDELTELELLELARAEAHRTIDHQVSTVDDIDDKAARVLRVNLILLGIVLTGVSIIASEAGVGAVDTIVNWYVLGGVGAIVASTILAAFTYTASEKRSGISGRGLAELLENDHPPDRNLRGLVESYSLWMQINFKANTRLAPLGTGLLVLLIYGIVLLTIGVYHATLRETGLPTAVGALALLGVFTWRSGIGGQCRRYWRYRDFDPTED